MKTDAELNTENSSTCGEVGGQIQVPESSSARRLGSEGATAEAARTAASAQDPLATGASDEGGAKVTTAQPVELSLRAENPSFAGDAGRDNQISAAAVGIESSDAAGLTPLGQALAALDRRDYTTARRLFEALGRNDVALAIDNALAALDRKDYATAQGLFEALTPLRPAPSARGPSARGPREKAQREAAISQPISILNADAAKRRAGSMTAKARTLGFARVLLRTGLALFAIFLACALYVSPADWTFATVRSQANAGLASAVDLMKPTLAALTGQSGREEERSQMRNLDAALTQVTIRLDQIEHDYGARLDELERRIDQNSSTRIADIAGRLDLLEKKAEAPASPAGEFADVTARVDKLEKTVAVPAAPPSEIADITSRLNRLEKRVAASAISSNAPLPPAAPKQSTQSARTEPSAPNEVARPDKPGPLLRGYSVEDVRGGVALIDGRYGPQRVAAGDFIPGAGRVLRIERRGGDWFVVTNRGVIASGPPAD